MNESNNKRVSAEARLLAEIYARKMPAEFVKAAEEDFEAGYLAGAREKESQLQFARVQIGTLIDMASRYGEDYSLVIARYTLERIK